MCTLESSEIIMNNVIHSGIIKNNSNTFAAFYRLIDVCLIQILLYVAVVSQHHIYTSSDFVLSLAAAVAFAMIAESISLYRSWRVGMFAELTFYTLVSWMGALTIVIVGLFLTKASENYSRITLVLWMMSGVFALVGWRYAFKILLSGLRKRGRNTRRIAIFGLSDTGIRLAQQTQLHPEIGYKLEAIFDDRAPERLDSKYHSLLKGNVQAGLDLASNNEFDIIYIALPLQARERIQQILSAFGDTTATVHVVPDLFMYCLMHGQMTQVGSMQTISVYDSQMAGGVALLKRIEDIFLSTIALILTAIPLVFIAIAIKTTSPGPVIFKQERYGLNGRKIKVWKFRTMKVMEHTDVVAQATKNDPRVTTVGAFLRRTSLDELPQFINALKGDMSVIGPRPHAVAHNETYRKKVNYYMLRHKVKPGITGWAQVNGWRGETDSLDKMKARVEYDLEYIRNWSLWLDFKIVILTVLRSFTDKNAY